MPSPSRCLTAGDAIAFVRDLAINQSTSSPRVGLELEWLTYPVDDHTRRVAIGELRAAIAAVNGKLPCASALTIEPGGQIEISTRPFDYVGDAIDAARTDAAALRATLADHGIEMIAAGVDRARPPERILDTARYRAMEAYFEADGPAGRQMMCNTASLQINVDVDGDLADAWSAAHVVARRFGDEYGGQCPNRNDIWSSIDRTRTAPVGGVDPREAWAEYALDARLMFIRIGADECVPVLDGTTLLGWLERGHPLGWPTEADVLEHLTTLFPPVRPRGFLELRTIDALADDVWPAVAERAVSLLLDGPARRELLEHAWS